MEVLYWFYTIIVTIVALFAIRFSVADSARIRGLAQDAENVLAVCEARGWEIRRPRTDGLIDKWSINGSENISLGRARRLACARYDAKEAADKMVAEEMARV
jgi:hypothetical protein